MGQKQGKARYHSGGIYQQRYADGKLGRVFWVRWREVVRRADGVVTYVQHRESTGSEDREYAERFLRSKLQDTGGRRPMDVDPKKIRYEDLRENYLARSVEKGLRSLKKIGKEEQSLDTMARLDSFFGGWKASEITQAHIRRFRQEGKDDGLSEVRLNRYVAILRAMFRQAAKDEIITAKEMPAYFPMVKERNEGRGAIFIQPEWYAALKKELSEPLRSAFILSYNSGIRVGGELRKLRWRHFDFAKRQITLPGEITKTGQARVIFLPNDFDRNPGKPDDLVFPVGDIREVWRAATVKVGAGWFECRECGARLNGRECPTHGKRWLHGMQYKGLLLRHTRHTAARNLVDAGLDRDRAKAITGHLTDSVFSRYNIGREKDVEAARQALEHFHKRKRK